jgi:hypothetical protein
MDSYGHETAHFLNHPTAPTHMTLDQWYNHGRRDGLNGNYDPPHDRFWGSCSEREQDERRSYKHGYEAGKKERERRR